MGNFWPRLYLVPGNFKIPYVVNGEFIEIFLGISLKKNLATLGVQQQPPHQSDAYGRHQR
jgi:hypothetical protein